MRRSSIVPRARAATVAALLVLGAPACARRETARPRAGPVSVLVRNSLTPPVRVDVFLLPTGATRRRLGAVGPGDNAVLRYDGPTAGQEFRLYAEGVATNRGAASRAFSLTGVATVEWDLYANTVTTQPRVD